MTFDDAVHSVTASLADIPGLHVGSPAFPPAPAPHALDDLQVLIREADLAGLDHAMNPGGRAGVRYPRVRWDAATGAAVPVARGRSGGIATRPSRPVTPDLAYSAQVVPGPNLWIQFHTTQRHGPLLLVDLEHWLPGQPGMAMPSTWALVLWQASIVTNTAADCAAPGVVQRELDRLRQAVGDLHGDWRMVRAGADQYDEEYLTRLDRFSAKITLYAGRLAPPVPPSRLVTVGGSVAGADLDYGVLYDLRHALEALEGQHPGTVPPGVLAHVQNTGTGVRRRKIWDSTGRLGIAGFTILQQMTDPRYAGLSAADLFTHGLVHADIQSAPAHGYWSLCSAADFRRIWAPPPPPPPPL